MWHSSLLSDVCVTLILLRAIQINFIIITINMMLKRTFGVSWATWELYVAVSFIYGTLKDVKKSRRQQTQPAAWLTCCSCCIRTPTLKFALHVMQRYWKHDSRWVRPQTLQRMIQTQAVGVDVLIRWGSWWSDALMKWGCDGRRYVTEHGS